jgi:hypothetical protein
MGKKLTAFLLTLLLCGFAVQGLTAPVQVELMQQLRADYAALVQARMDFEQSRKSGKLGSAEETDYANWIRQLNDQVIQDCQALTRISTGSLPEDLPCSKVTASNPAPAAIDIAAESTTAEDTDRMIEQLNGSLGEFDERLLREQDRVKARTPRSENAGGGSGGGGAGSAGSDDLPGDTGDSGKKSGQSASDNDSDSQGDGTAASRQGTAGKPLPGAKSSAPDDIPDGSDDDVIARQLREAAEKETDPELKKKLWEEYRRYKAGIE